MMSLPPTDRLAWLRGVLLLTLAWLLAPLLIPPATAQPAPTPPQTAAPGDATYAGTLPCADCAGQQIVLTLFADQTFRIHAHRGPMPRLGRVFEVASDGAVTQAFGRLYEKAGIKGLRLHDMRAECVSRLLERGWAMNEVMAVSGHRNAVAMQSARHNAPEDLARKLG
jgi:hypothetical protein